MHKKYHKYYLPIRSYSLSYIFAYGCILPARLYMNRPKDVQTNFDDLILLTTNHGCNECDCCLEVVLTDEEIESCIDIDNRYYLYEKIIPISRICRIEFKDEYQKSSTITSILLSTAYIPQNIVTVCDKFDSVPIKIENRPLDLNPDLDTVRKKWEMFNRYLGALALMRVAKEDGLTYSPRFIDTLSYFNEKIKLQKEEYKQIDTTFHSIFEQGQSYFERIVDEDLLNRYARAKGLKIIKNPITRLIELNKIHDAQLYFLAILFTFGCGGEVRKKKIDDLILTNFQSVIERDKSEAAAFYYGYNRGYAVFSNVYKTDGKNVEVKFRLESMLDYYIIESVFNKAFNNQISSTFDYIDEWCNKKVFSKSRKGEYLILDTVIRDKKKEKIFSFNWWKEFMGSFQANHNFKINIFGKEEDLTNEIETSILRPFADTLKNEILEELNESFDLKEEEYKKQIDELKSKNSNNEKLLAEYGNLQDVKADPLNTNNEEVVIKKIIDLYKQYDKWTTLELKNKLKSSGLKIDKKKKLDLVIKAILMDNNKKE